MEGRRPLRHRPGPVGPPRGAERGDRGDHPHPHHRRLDRTPFTAAGVPAGEINDIGQVFANPQVRHLGLAQPVVSQERGPTELVGQPIIMSRTPSHIASPPPLAGQHTADLLAEIGYSEAEIAAMKASGAI